MNNEKFATVINCIDGRVQDPVKDWIVESFRVEFVDVITEPGDDKILSLGSAEKIEEIKQKVEVSIQTHNSKVIVIVGHFNCSGNIVVKEEHVAEIKKGMEIVKSWNFGAQVVGLWVDENWEAGEVK